MRETTIAQKHRVTSFDYMKQISKEEHTQLTWFDNAMSADLSVHGKDVEHMEDTTIKDLCHMQLRSK